MSVEQGYDIIGDIHGYASPLKELLDSLGYIQENGRWQHPEQRKVIFTGDYLHGGGQDRQVLTLVRSLVDQGMAHAILGNHEINVIHHYWQNPSGHPLHAMSERQRAAHHGTELEFVRKHPEEWNEWIQWLRQLPLWLDFGFLRVVHACWHERSMRKIRSAVLSDEVLRESAEDGVIRQALRNLIQGTTIPSLKESDARPVRIAWWKPVFDGIRFVDVSLDELVDSLDGPILSQEDLHFLYEESEPLLFIGHYNRQADHAAAILAPNIICVDQGIKDGGRLAAYRWTFGEAVDARNFCSVR